ncbi:MAG TPA: TylF/MycF/NovP-related O-methyltransferase [Terracidiphilus sp.]|nr:TylF/MycF/NovP-related O-methyltransferase [Terracidiphilus sp.]
MLRKILSLTGYELRRNRPRNPNERNIPGGALYRPLFSPWLGQGDFRKYYALAAPRTLVSPDRCYVLWILLRQALNLSGDIWECGVYRGGTAAMMAAVLRDSAQSDKKLFLFDTFQGMPETDSQKDLHRKGDFGDTSVQAVRDYVGGEICILREGLIPYTFKGLESARIAFAHVDLDIYRSILDCLSFVWPRLTVGGFIVFDDYGFPSCPGARTAVDEFFAPSASVPLCLPTGQAVVFKGVPDRHGVGK